jgi:apolipoprotein N-acyltransferase
MSLLARSAVAAVSGLAVYSGFPPHGHLWALFLGLVGLFLGLHGMAARSGAMVGLVFGMAFMVPLLRWLTVLGPDAWLALSVLCALFYALFGWAAALTSRLPAPVAWAGACWVGMEMLRANIPFGGFPWGRIAFATADSELVALNRWVGVPATGGVIVLAAAATAWGLMQLRSRSAYILAARGLRGAPGGPGGTGQHRAGGGGSGRRARNRRREPRRAPRGDDQSRGGHDRLRPRH